MIAYMRAAAAAGAILAAFLLAPAVMAGGQHAMFTATASGILICLPVVWACVLEGLVKEHRQSDDQRIVRRSRR